MGLSTMMEHYLSIKEQYKDCIVFYRLGDFYEMFFEDAKVASQALELTLTGRDCGLKERAPMCGIPYHAADTYISKLIEQGYKVAICEQLSQPGDNGKKIVDRDVIRVVTSGTLIEEGQIDEKKNNYVSCVYFNDKDIALSWADITTGEFIVRCFESESELLDTLTRIAPAEIIVNGKYKQKLNESPLVTHGVLPKCNEYKENAFNLKIATNNLLTQFNVATLSSFGISENDSAIICAGALIEYVKETQKHTLKIISNVLLERKKDYMVIDNVCSRNLELVKSNHDGKTYGSLLWVLDHTKTSMGARLLRKIVTTPLQSIDAINNRLDGVAELKGNLIMLNSIRDDLNLIKDIERIAGKISNANVTPRDMETLGKSLEVLPSIKFRLTGVKCKLLNDIYNSLIDLSKLTSLLQNAIKENAPVLSRDGNFIKQGFDEQLDRLRAINDNGKAIIREIEEREREKTGIKSLKITYNKVFGYSIEVTNSFKDKVPFDYVRKQTLSNAERYITEELKNFEEEILTSSTKAIRIESDIFAKLNQVLLDNLEDIKKIARAISILDVISNFAFIAKNNNYVKPEMCESGNSLDIVGGRHPVVESVSKETFIENDTLLDNAENSMMIITGPNMAGKSTYMRQVAIITIMAHIGCFVPAKSAQIPIVDRIFTRVGANDNLIFDQSTFMVEMSEVALILRSATKKSLVILDEVGRGTSTYDGLSIAWATVEYIAQNLRAKTLFATHYHELSELEGVLEGVKNYKITVKEYGGSIIFLRRIMRGSANKSFGIEVASLAGIPQNVTNRAKQILKGLEKNDLVKVGKVSQDSNELSPNLSQVEQIIAELDMDNLTPRQAYTLLSDLKEKIN